MFFKSPQEKWQQDIWQEETELYFAVVLYLCLPFCYLHKVPRVVLIGCLFLALYYKVIRGWQNIALYIIVNNVANEYKDTARRNPVCPHQFLLQEVQRLLFHYEVYFNKLNMLINFGGLEICFKKEMVLVCLWPK